MRQVFLDKGSVVVKNVSQPFLDDYSLLVSVHYSYISSGTEVATIHAAKSGLFSNVPHKVKKILESVASNGIEGTAALIKSKLRGESYTLGYSCAGHVIAVGKKVRKFRPGDLVACAGSGYANHADLVCVPENLAVRVSKKELLKAASLTTIGAIALQGLRRSQVSLGERVCIIGLGLLGQLTVQLAKHAGCVVYGIDVMQDRMKMAKTLGADEVFHASDSNVAEEINLLTEHHGADATIIAAASKSSEIIRQAMEITRKKGRVVVVGDVGMNIEREQFYKKEIDFLISCSYGPGRYDTEYEQFGHDYPYPYVRWTENRNMAAFVRLIERNEILLDKFISEKVTVDQAAQAYKKIQSRESLGVVLDYGTKNNHTTSYAPPGQAEKSGGRQFRFTPAKKDSIRVGVVGAGGFAKVKLIPIVSKIRNVQIKAVVDRDIANSLNVSKAYGVATAISDDSQLYTDDLVDVVVIASPHKYHSAQAIKSLENGKAVFLEKPMVTDFEQLAEFKKLFEQSKPLLCVDYNRSFSPFMRKIRKVVKKRKAPLMVQYRMNAGYVAKEHWVQSDLGAGRIIGEACHIVDLFCYLIDSHPVAVSVEALQASRNDIFPTDNFSAQISFADGSVASLMYTALGHAKLGKERMELFFDKKAIVMDDYLELYGYGLPSWFNETVTNPNKGHENLIHTFFHELKKETYTSPIAYDRLLTVAELTLIIDQLACEGGGKKEIAL